MMYSRVQKNSPDSPYQYVSSGSKVFIVWLVIALHLAIFVIPGIIYAIVTWLQPDKVLVSKVVLVDSLPNEHTAPSRNPGEAAEPQNDFVQPPDVPDIPEVREVEVPPKPKKVPQEKPRPKPVKTEKTVPAEKKIPKPEKKSSWKPLDAKDIKIQKNPNAGKKTPTIQKKNGSFSKLAGEIRSGAKAGGAGGPMGKYSPDANDYYSNVGAYLRMKWVDQPDVSALGGRRPVVEVQFHISPDGRILSTKILKPSGVAVMDASVQRFLRSLTRIPAPPRKDLTRFTVWLRIED